MIKCREEDPWCSKTGDGGAATRGGRASRGMCCVVNVDRCLGQFLVRRSGRQRLCDQRCVFGRLGGRHHLGCRGVRYASVHVG